jgi:ABC-type uncharacterized transport system substrate-binding protein
MIFKGLSINALKKALVLLLVLPMFHALAQSPSETIILVSNDSVVTQSFIESVSLLSEPPMVLNISNNNPLFRDLIEAKGKQVVIVGKLAFEFYLNNQVDIPAVVVFVKRNTFYHLMEAFSHRKFISGAADHTDKISVIYEDPSLELQLQLVKEHYPYNAVAVMYSDINSFLVEELKSITQRLNMPLHLLNVPRNVNINQALNSLPKNHALLAIPDSVVYNRLSIKSIYLSTYRIQRPIFGFSLNTVKAGSVASYFSNESDFAKQAVEILANVRSKPYRDYAIYSELAINEAVARSLNLNTLKKDKG